MALASSPSRRDELRAFLRSRRARLSPADVGLPNDGARRRTPGLRREELASLAGVGVSWYTWLEQGRDIHPSPEVLDALARTLRLDAAERATLFSLARTELPLPDGSGTAPGEGEDDGRALLVSLVEGLHPTPAYLVGRPPRATWWRGSAASTRATPASLPTSSSSPSCTSVARGLRSGGASTRSTTLSAGRRRSSIPRWGRCACTMRRRCRPGRLTSGSPSTRPRTQRPAPRSRRSRLPDLMLSGGHRVADLGGIVEPLHVVLIEIDVSGGDVLLEVLDRAGAGNQQDPLGAVQ